MDKPLHPNLARIAAEYDTVVLAFHQGRIAPPEARRRILALVARDDNGVEWSIDPDSGQWRYRTKWGSHEHGTPPAYGVPGVTPAAFGSGAPSADEERVSMHEVDLTLLVSPQTLQGTTLVQGPSARRRLMPSVSARAAAGMAMVGTAVVFGAVALYALSGR